MTSATFLNETGDGYGLWHLPTDRFAKGDKIKVARPDFAKDYEPEGEILAQSRSGVIAAFAKRTSPAPTVPIRKTASGAPTPAQTKEPAMTLTKVQKALGHARIGATLNADEYNDAITEIAEGIRKDDPGLTPEQAFAKACRTRDGRELRIACQRTASPSHRTAKAIREAEDARFAKRFAEPKGVEGKLEKMARDRAAETGEPIEQARAAVAKSREGRELRAEAMM